MAVTGNFFEATGLAEYLLDACIVIGRLMMKHDQPSSTGHLAQFDADNVA